MVEQVGGAAGTPSPEPQQHISSQAPGELSSIPGYEFALIGSKVVKPSVRLFRYYGTKDFGPNDCLAHDGLPRRGEDIDLIGHADRPPGYDPNRSAFRGTTPYPLSPLKDSGAVLWAGEGGWIYEIKCYVGYDLNCLLDGKIPNGIGGFRGPKYIGEHEDAIPARVPKGFISRIGIVKKGRRGLLPVWPQQGAHR